MKTDTNPAAAGANQLPQDTPTPGPSTVIVFFPTGMLWPKVLRWLDAHNLPAEDATIDRTRNCWIYIQGHDARLQEAGI